MIELDGGEFMMGSTDRFAYPDDGEGPVRSVRVAGFAIDACAVSNAEFAHFVEDTGHVTEAEHFGWSFVFGGLLQDDFPPTRGVATAPWWRQVEHADWRRPEGPRSDLDGRSDHGTYSRGATSWSPAASTDERLAGHLCHDSDCRRYQVAARNSMEPDSTTGNTGFRCVEDR